MYRFEHKTLSEEHNLQLAGNSHKYYGEFVQPIGMLLPGKLP